MFSLEPVVFLLLSENPSITSISWGLLLHFSPCRLNPFNVWDDIVWYHVLVAISEEWKEPMKMVQSPPAATKSMLKLRVAQKISTSQQNESPSTFLVQFYNRTFYKIKVLFFCKHQVWPRTKTYQVIYEV